MYEAHLDSLKSSLAQVGYALNERNKRKERKESKSNKAGKQYFLLISSVLS